MNYLWNAAAALTNAGGVPGLPAYTLGEKDLDFEGRTIWSLHQGVKKEDATPVSIFVFDPSAPSSSRNAAPLARNALRKLRALRHPDVLKFLDGTEANDAVYIVTEPVTSLARRLDQVDALSDEAKVWGLSRLTNALKFVNASAASTHGNLRPSSIFLSPSGEWKLGGFEVLSSPKDSTPELYTMGGLLRDSGTYASPEVRRSGYGVLRECVRRLTFIHAYRLDPHVLDSYQFHLLLHVLFNGPLPTAFSTELAPTLPNARGNIPASIFPAMRKLGSPEPRSRMKIETLCDIGFGLTSQAGAGFFKTNRLVRLQEGLEGFALASESDRLTLVKTVKDSVDVLPPEFLKYKVLPALVHAFEFGQGGPQLLPIVLSLGTSLPPAEYSYHLIQPVVRMFASPDRLMRMALLENFPSFAEKLDQKTVVDKLTGFTDVVPVIREATVKAVPFIAPKLSDRLLNNDLLRYLAKTQMDAEPGIRTNTCILLGRLSKHLNPVTCRKVLVPAFARALRDPFVHARIAGLMALMATVECYEKEDLAAKVIPSMSICLVDKEKTVRDQAFKAIDMFVKRVSELIVGMPDTVLVQPSPNLQTVALPDPVGASVPGLATNAAGAAGALAGWAFSSLGKKLMPADLASPIQGAASPSTAPNGLNGSTVQTHTLSHAQSTSSLRETAAMAAPSDVGDWGGDLMDPNADDDDWNNFEEAPAPLEVPISKLSIQASRPKPPLRSASSSGSGTLKLGGAASGRLRSQLAMELEAEAAEEAAPTAAWQAMAAAAAANQAKKVAAAPVTARPVARTPARVVTPAAAPKPAPAARASVADNDGWGDFDDATTPTKVTPASPTRTAAPANEDKAATMARMKAERQARMAALRAARKA